MLIMAALASALAPTVLLAPAPANAQAARGAAASFERVREVMTNRVRDTPLAGDPDHDFAALLLAHHEDLVFLARTQLEYGGDTRLREIAQKIADGQQREIAEVKDWQVRNKPTNLPAAAQAAPAPALAAPSQTAPTRAAASSPPPATDLPTVSGRVEKVDPASGKITIDHQAIPNLGMDPMTMVFRTPDPAVLKGVKAGDKVRFQADRVNGQISVVKIQKGK
ncbi:copper-binding protein [Alsobacter sp. SYSU BS001988]